MNRKLQRVLVGLVSLSMLAAPFVSGAALANICGKQLGYWRATSIPRFKAGPQTFVDYEVDRGSPNNIMITNGTAVMLSTDSACSWKQAFVLPGSPSPESQATAANSKIVSIDISEAVRGRVLLMVEETTPLGSRPHIVRSDNMGESWEAGDVGLPPQGRPEALVLPVSDPNLVYLGTDVGGDSIDLLFASTDGGASWTLRSNPTALTQSMGITGFTVDPIDAASVWAWGTNGLHHSTDGGATFTAVEDFIGKSVSTASVFHAGSKKARISGFIPNEQRVLVSTNGGGTWLSLTAPPGVDSSVAGISIGEEFVTAAGHAFGFDLPTSAWINLGSPRPGVLDASTDRSGTAYFRTARDLLTYDGPSELIRNDPGSVFQPGLIDPPRQYQEHDPVLTPSNKSVVLEPGQTKTVTYDLAISKTPLPVNVFFLLDTSDSMGATIEDLSKSVVSITNLLNKENFKLKIGVGAYRAFPDRLEPRPPCDGSQQLPGQTCEANYVFRNFYDIAPADREVEEILGNLESDAGGFYKSHLQALYTLATGERVDVFPPGESGADVPAGEGATFDQEAYRVVIHATDEPFWKGEARESGPSDFGNPTPPETPLFDEVEAALDAKSIFQVGLSIGPAPRRDLAEVARRTDALAPAEGVDCGKGHFLEPGEPLVCPVKRDYLSESHNLVPAIVNLIENLPAGVDVKFEAKGDKRIVKEVTPKLEPDVVLQVANDMTFDVTYRCPLNLAGKRFDVDLSATNLKDAQLLDDATTRVVCREPELPPVIPPIVTVSLVALAIPPPPPPPPAQLTSASQAQSQAQAQTGAVFEEEKEPQLAIAAAYREAAQMENDYQYEMVAYESRRPSVSPYLTLGAGAVLASMAYAGLMVQRTRQNRRLALQYSRRR